MKHILLGIILIALSALPPFLAAYVFHAYPSEWWSSIAQMEVIVMGILLLFAGVLLIIKGTDKGE